MKNKKTSSNASDKKAEEDRLKNKNGLIDPSKIDSISNLWQKYSPIAWSEIYSEYVSYTRRMTEIYNEYAKSSHRMAELYKELAANTEKMTELYKESAKSTEKMTKYWVDFLWMKPLAEDKE
jgi:hypothetical protein